MNILICSVGRRVKLVEYFRKELNQINGMVVAVDCDPTAPALYHADAYEIVPRIDHQEYISHIKYHCHKYQINAVLSLIDPELSLLAGFKDEFAQDGIEVIVSEKKIVDICFDKYQTYEFLRKREIPAVPTYVNLNEVMNAIKIRELQFPLIVKPRKGSASIGISMVTSLKQLEEYRNEEMVIQPFINGEEYGVDCYIDLITNKPSNIFMKRKIKMRAGETDKSISVKDPELKALVGKLIDVLNPSGPIDIDCFKKEDKYIISEINPRFGGGYLHAHEMGQNFVKNIINNLSGRANTENSPDYKEGTTLVKYDNYLVL
ncbi:ATP-grasp domain-containing protein [Robertmurraya andreesenii]|uniref:Carbamoyl-phosphate synthase large subunit n=1 Tax=Anoxybacillus andreesenii TaxID=1325932 RepID=A0ABT9V357_9BACL|nr:ATP-grasp domain-containing protein [Robertmurraya andreesenii]MDQ0155380.1 carbamoyl-phosphate synthase large subunit [Robertmurraya andreesenii]